MLEVLCPAYTESDDDADSDINDRLVKLRSALTHRSVHRRQPFGAVYFLRRTFQMLE